jgi:anti-sigma B factor antagonist
MTAPAGQAIRDAIRHHRRYHQSDGTGRPGSIQQCCVPPCHDEVQAWYAARRVRRVALAGPPRDFPGAGQSPGPRPQAAAGYHTGQDRGGPSGELGGARWMGLSLFRRSEGDVDVIAVAGEADICTAPRLADMASQLVAGGRRHLVIDLSQCTFLDAAGLGIIVGTRNRAGQNGDVVLACTREPILKLLRVTGLASRFRVYDTAEKAVAVLRGEAAEAGDA